MEVLLKLLRYIPLLLGLCAFQAHAADTIRLTVSGISCTGNTNTFPGMAAEAWSMGASVPTVVGTGGGGAGKVTLSGLVVQRAFDECSPILLKDLFNGTHIATLTLTQYKS